MYIYIYICLYIAHAVPAVPPLHAGDDVDLSQLEDEGLVPHLPGEVKTWLE